MLCQGLTRSPGPKPLKECHRPTSFPRRLCTSSGCSCCLVPASRAAPLRIKPEHILIPVIQRPQLLSLLHPRTPSSLVRLPAQGVLTPLRNQICHQRTEIGHAEAYTRFTPRSSLKSQEPSHRNNWVAVGRGGLLVSLQSLEKKEKQIHHASPYRFPEVRAASLCVLEMDSGSQLST